MNKTKLAVMAAVMAGSIGIGMIGCVANQSNVDTESKTVQKHLPKKRRVPTKRPPILTRTQKKLQMLKTRILLITRRSGPQKRL